MKLKKNIIIFGILIILNLLTRFAASNSDWVEKNYSGKFFPHFSAVLRSIFSVFPFSIGDILYGLIVVLVLCKVTIFFFNKNYKNKLFNKLKIINITIYTLNYILVTFLLFNLCWGVNYYRKGIGEQLGLAVKKYNTVELSALNGLLLKKVNLYRSVVAEKALGFQDERASFKSAIFAYKKSQRIYPFLKYEPVCIKSSLWSGIGNYMGVSGYYNPLTGEAQVNTSVPGFLLPFTACHEMAHQLGYAKESEANFVGYVVAESSDDIGLKYSAYLEMFMYANRNLYYADSVTAIAYRRQLSENVKLDLERLNKFYKDHQSFIEPAVSWFYDKFLKSNNQPSGMFSYSEVTAYLVAFYKKFGTI